MAMDPSGSSSFVNETRKRAAVDETSAVPVKKPCRYGAACYRKNPTHLAQFDHSGFHSVPSTSGNDANSSTELASTSNVVQNSVKSDELYGFYLFRVRGIQYGNTPTISLSDILDTKFGQLESSAQFNYMFDVDWLMNQYPRSFRNAPLLIVHGFQGSQKQALDAACVNHTNIERCQAHIRLPYGTHHTKMMLLQYAHGLRIVIHTANMIPDDWNLRTQGIWISPLLSPTDAPSSATDSSTRFRADLKEYLKSYGSSAFQNPTKGLGRWLKLLDGYDFRAIKVYLVGSVSGRFTGTNMKTFGHLRLKELLRTHTHDAPSSWPIVGQFSSIGSLGPQPTSWLTTEWSSSFAGRGARGIRLIYPCVEDVRNSLEGYAAGGCLPYSQQTANKQPWLRQFLHRWSAGAHTRAGPHIKSYSRISPDGYYATWFLLTSANLSKAAWGALEKNGSQLTMRSYELGVLFVPSQFELKANCFQLYGPHKAVDNGEAHAKLPELMQATKIAFPRPYRLPPEPYTTDDQPWIVDKVYSAPDTFGHVWHPQ